MKLTAFIPLVFLGCSGFSLTDEPAESDPDANALLPKDVGVFITESSASLDVAAIETIQPSTHRRTEITGVGLDTDMQLRRLRDAAGKEHIFTVQSSQGVVVRRDREGRAIARYDVFEAGKPASRANPLDVAFDEDQNLWVTRHGATSLIVFSPTGDVVTTIDLAAFADDDGIPDMSAIAILGRTAYVALRRLENGFGTTKNTSTVVAIDTETFAVRPFLELPAKDPGAKFKQQDGALFISCIGGPLLPTGPDRNAALVRIDVASATATKLLAAEKAGGFVTAFDLAGEKGYAVIAEFGGENATKVVRFDPATGAMDEPWASVSRYRFWDVVAVRGLLLIADRDPGAPGLRVLSTVDGANLGRIPTLLLPIEALAMFPPDA